MSSGLEFFLTHRVRDAEDDYRGWEWYVLDSERLHQDMLQILLNASQEFCQKLVGHDGKCIRGSQLFDLIVRSEAHPVVPGTPICGIRMPSAAGTRGYSVAASDRRLDSPAGAKRPKKLPPACG